uniref:FLYWCH-type domain-containing protein n=1 Tax=Phlebotomus papatasi TaxID=29031 RepID=A0A1B0GN84_PHLPP
MNGYRLRLERSSNKGIVYWRCVKGNCRGRVNISKGKIIKKQPHDHEPPDYVGLDFIYSQRGHPLLIIDDYLFRHNRGHYWRCIGCTKYSCRSRVILKPGRQPWCIGEHTHPQETEKIRCGSPPVAVWIPNPKVIFTETERGRQLLNFRGYTYKKETTFKTSINWICAEDKENRNGACNARCVTRQDGAIKLGRRRHNHSNTLT